MPYPHVFASAQSNSLISSGCVEPLCLLMSFLIEVKDYLSCLVIVSLEEYLAQHNQAASPPHHPV
eukprot:103757-Karenia_brevis.AAC.1